MSNNPPVTNTVIGEHLFKAVACCEPIASKANDTMRFVRILATVDDIKFQATDCEAWVCYKTPGEFQPFDCVVSSVSLAKIAKANKGAGAFVLTLARNKMKVSVGSANYEIPAMPTGLWREEPSTDGGRMVVCNSKGLARAIKRVHASMGEPERYQGGVPSSGIAFATGANGTMRLLAPSQVGLGVEEIPAEFAEGDKSKMLGIIPRRAVMAAWQSSPNWGDRVAIQTTKNCFSFVTDNYEMIGVLVYYEKIPDFKPMMDRSGQIFSAKMNKETLQFLLDKAKVFCEIEIADSEKKKLVSDRLVFHFERGKVTVQSQDNGDSLSSCTQDCAFEGQERMTFKAKASYVQDFANALDQGEKFELGMREKTLGDGTKVRNSVFMVAGSLFKIIMLIS